MRRLTKVVFFSQARFPLIYHVLKERQLKKMRRLAISPYIYREIKKGRARESWLHMVLYFLRRLKRVYLYQSENGKIIFLYIFKANLFLQSQIIIY